MDATGLYRFLMTDVLEQPKAEQEPYYSLADSLGGYAGALSNAAANANQHMTRLLSSGSGEAMDALGEHWNTVRTQKVQSVADAGTRTTDVAREIADGIAATKSQIVGIASQCVQDVMAAQAAAAFTFGAAEAAVLPAVQAAKSVSAQVVAKCNQHIASRLSLLQQDPAVAGLPDVAASLSGAASGGIAPALAAGAAVAGAGGGGDAWGGALPPGGGSGAGKGIEVDHAEHVRAAGALREVATEAYGIPAGTVTPAAAQNGVGAGSGELGAAISATLGTVLDNLGKATTAFGDYLNGTLPDAVLRISGDQQTTDDGNRNRFGRMD
ncbi:hypothetical protein [Streptomyces sp. NPDC008122]|uniref:hypothetical protein n=1 Tax=Streptomyces sp. NPDC008122 TaxID=3364810 RepID=UPI0036EAC57E